MPEDKDIKVEVKEKDLAPEETPDTGAAGDQMPEEERLRARVAELEEQLLLGLADLDNHRKRSARQFSEIIRTANDKLLGELLEVVDNFERALSHADDEKNSASLLEGTQLIAKQMADLLARYEIKPIDALGEKFDAARHEALMTVSSDEYPEGTVAVEMSRGYMIGDRILRYSKVGVSKGAESPETNDNKNEIKE